MSRLGLCVLSCGRQGFRGTWCWLNARATLRSLRRRLTLSVDAPNPDRGGSFPRFDILMQALAGFTWSVFLWFVN